MMEGTTVHSSNGTGLGSTTDQLNHTTISNFFKHMEITYGRRTSDLLKNWTSTKHKLSESKAHRKFLLRCRSNDVIPHHIADLQRRLNNISTRSKFCTRTLEKFTLSVSHRLLNLETTDINIHINFLHKKLERLSTDLTNLHMNDNILTQFFDFTDSRSNRIYVNKYISLDKKLNTLTNYDEKPTAKRDWVKNLTDVHIPDNVIDVVSLGPKYNVTSKLDKDDVISTIKNLEYSLEKLEMSSLAKQDIRERTSSILKSNYKKSTHITAEDRKFARKLTETKLFLKNNRNVFFTHADKGNVTVCMSKSDYNRKMNLLLGDQNTYITEKRNPLKKLQSKTYEILKDFNNKGFFHKKFHKNNLTQTDTTLAKAYGLPKIHKTGIPLRPIISTINSPTHSIAKLVYNELKDIFPNPSSHINNSYELKNELESVTIPDDYILASLDVSSLFTNVTRESVINSLERRAMYIHTKCKIPFQEIIETIEFMYNNTYFQFDGKFYKQIKGTPMGSPISPLLANIVMEDVESECLYDLKRLYNIIPIFYKRYVDDTIICVKKADLDTVLQVFNSKHVDLKFTHEIENNNRINFLDIMLIRESGKLITNWYQKPSSSNRVLNFLSNHPIQLKRNIVYNLVDRAILLSHKKFHHENIKIVKRILQENQYTDPFIEKCIKNRICKITSSKNVNNHRDNRFTYVTIPFHNNFFNETKSSLLKYNIGVVPKINKKLDDIIIRGKDRCKTLETPGVVYKISCKTCPSSYVGETKRKLSDRIYEHKSKKCPESVVSIHSRYNHEFDWNNVKILDREQHYNKRLISEMIHIHCENNTINKKEDVQRLGSVYKALFKSIGC